MSRPTSNSQPFRRYSPLESHNSPLISDEPISHVSPALADTNNFHVLDYEQRLDDYLKQYRSLARKHRKLLSGLKVSKAERKRLRYALGTHKHSDRLRASSARGRYGYLKSQKKALEATFGKQGSLPSRFWFVTIKEATWCSLDRDLALDLYGMKQRVQRSLWRVDKEFNFYGWVEVTPVAQFPRRGLGRAIMPHVHLIAWTKTGSPRAIEKKLRGLRYNAPFSARGVHVSRIASHQQLQLAMAYSAKPPTSQKEVLKKLGETKEFLHYKLRTHADMRDDLYIRLIRALSLVETKDLIIAGRIGVEIRSSIQKSARRRQQRLARVAYRESHPFSETRQAWSPHFAKRFANDKEPRVRLARRDAKIFSGKPSRPSWL